MPLEFRRILETPRLLVRPVAAEDLPALMAVNGDPEVTRFLPYRAWESMDDARAWLERMRGFEAGGTTVQLVVVERATGSAIGTCLVFRYDAAAARAELGFVLGRAHWRSGIMREALEPLLECAFREMGIRRFDAVVVPQNTASARLLQRLGFVRDGSSGELDRYALTRSS